MYTGVGEIPYSGALQCAWLNSWWISLITNQALDQYFVNLLDASEDNLICIFLHPKMSMLNDTAAPLINGELFPLLLLSWSQQSPLFPQ